MNIKGQCHPLILVKGHSDFKIIACFFSETVKTFETKFHMKDYGLLLCFHFPNDVLPEPQRNVSIAAVRGAVRPSKKLMGE